MTIEREVPEPAGVAAGVVSDELVAAVVSDAAAGGVDLLGPDGVLAELTKRVLERALAEELTDHLGYEHGDPMGHGTGNNRNGSTPKQVLTEIGAVDLDVPRDRNATFDPRIVPKGARRLEGFNANAVPQGRRHENRSVAAEVESLRELPVQRRQGVLAMAHSPRRPGGARSEHEVGSGLGYMVGLLQTAADAMHLQRRLINQAQGDATGPSGGLLDDLGWRRPPVAGHGNGESGPGQLEDVTQVVGLGGHRWCGRDVAGPQHGQEHHQPRGGIGQMNHHDLPYVTDDRTDLLGGLPRFVPEIAP